MKPHQRKKRVSIHKSWKHIERNVVKGKKKQNKKIKRKIKRRRLKMEEASKNDFVYRRFWVDLSWVDLTTQRWLLNRIEAMTARDFARPHARSLALRSFARSSLLRSLLRSLTPSPRPYFFRSYRVQSAHPAMCLSVDSFTNLVVHSFVHPLAHLLARSSTASFTLIEEK